jgi:hypothetical protein
MGLCTLLKNEAWKDVIGETDVNEIWEKFYATFNYLLNIARPFIRKKILCSVNNKWINDEVTRARSKLQFLYKLHKETNTKANKLLYTSYKRQYLHTVKTTMANFIRTSIAGTKNMSKTVWSFVNEERCRRDKNTVANISLHQNGNVVSQPQVICKILTPLSWVI